jgi:thiamine biosynthesis lipoprotein
MKFAGTQSSAGRILRLGCILVGLASLALPKLSFGAAPIAGGRYVMGTVLEVTLYSDSETRSRAILAKLFERAAALDSILTSFDQQSALSRLNRQSGHGPQIVDAELADVLRLSVDYWKQTRGTFDITVGPLESIWRNAARKAGQPAESEISGAMTKVGSDKVKFRGQQTVELTNPGMSLDLGGIGKGYALDRMRGQLHLAGVKRALLVFGQSSIWAVGAPPGSDGWRLALRDQTGGVAGVVTLKDQALSVSATFGTSMIIGGTRYGHVIDPRNGRPLTRNLQACVVAPTAAQAEALSKALLILGEHDGITMLQQKSDVEGLLIDDAGGTWSTPGWTKAVAFLRFSDSAQSSASGGDLSSAQRPAKRGSRFSRNAATPSL